MASLASKMFMLSVVLCVYVCGIKGRPNSNLDDETVMKDQQNFAETDLFKRSKTKGGGEDKGKDVAFSFKITRCCKISTRVLCHLKKEKV